MSTHAISRIHFVCLGNICRSPLVEVVARERLRRMGMAIEVVSSGTDGWHVGKGADARMQAAAHAAGYDLASHRARQFDVRDLPQCDLILVMDRSNLSDIQRLAQPVPVAGVALFLPWSGIDEPQEFPDPYYGDEAGFAASVALAERGVAGLISRLARR